MVEWEILADGIKIFHGDFRSANIPAIAHIITDPPYEQKSHDARGRIRRNDGQKAPEALTFSSVDTIRADLVTLAKEKCSGWALFFCTTEGVAIWRDEIEGQRLKYKTPCIWVKPDAMPKFNGQGPSHGHECLVTAWCGPSYSKWNGGGRRGIFEHMTNAKDRHGAHPTEKPISLMMELVALFTNPGDIVCDPCMGSGTTGIACARLGRKFLGCELNREYYSVAKDRIALVLGQPDMFVEVPQVKYKQERLWLSPKTS